MSLAMESACTKLIFPSFALAIWFSIYTTDVLMACCQIILQGYEKFRRSVTIGWIDFDAQRLNISKSKLPDSWSLQT